MLSGYGDWRGLEQVCCVTRWRTIKGEKKREKHYCIASLSQERIGPKGLLHLIRTHWDVENGLHYVRDVTFKEDHCRVRTRSAPIVFMHVRNTVLALLRNLGHTNIAAAVEELQCHPPSAVRLILCREN